MVAGITSQAFSPTTTEGTLAITPYRPVHKIKFETLATPGLRSGGAKASLLGVDTFTPTRAVGPESHWIGAKLLDSVHRLISSFAEKPCAVFRVGPDPSKAALLAGPLLRADALTVLRVGSEAVSVASLRGDLPLGRS